MNNEISHYVVTAHPPGSVSMTTKCSFLAEGSMDVLVAKSRRIEVRQLRSPDVAMPSPFPVVLQLPINGKLTSMLAFRTPASRKAFVFFTTEHLNYGIISHDSAESPYPIRTHVSGSLREADGYSVGREAPCGLLAAVDPFFRCIALHVFDGLITVFPINPRYRQTSAAKGNGEDEQARDTQPLLGDPFHCRIEEQTVLALTFLQTESDEAMPQLCILHQDARGSQHLISHIVNIRKQQLHLFGSHSAPATTQWLKKSSIDGGSSLLVPLPPKFQAPAAASASPTNAASTTLDPNNSSTTARLGGVIVLGQRQFTYCSPTVTKVVPVPQALFLSFDLLPPDPSGMPRFLIGDEFGNLHMLTLITLNEKVVSIQFDTLGSCTLSSSLAYLGEGLVYVGSNLSDSQLVQIHDEPITEDNDDIDLADTTYLTVVEEYTNLGPILDFDLVPTTPGSSVDNMTTVQQSQVVTASGSSKSGSLRLIRNGIGMNEYASVEIPGIQNMWSIRKSFHDRDDSYLVQSFVGETRVLGVAAVGGDEMQEGDDEEEVGGTLEEVFLPGLESTASTLFVGNIHSDIGDRLVQITESAVRLVSVSDGLVIDIWEGEITVATANEAGQVAVAMRGGNVAYFCIEGDAIEKITEKRMEREVSCLNLRPFAGTTSWNAMDVDGSDISHRVVNKGSLLAIGLWDDFTVRLLSVEQDLEEALCINLNTLEEDEEEGSNRNNRNNMMARSLCLITMDFSSSSQVGGSGNFPLASGLNMLFVGLGDGSLISFAVATESGKVSVRSRKEVCLGTQRIDLVPLASERGGACILATGDRPTVIYLAGVGGSSSSQFNPKLCYSNVNLSAGEDEETDDVSRPPSQQAIAVNVATPFFSPLLFDASTLGNQHYSLCVADDSNLRLGVIDDIQKLHVTTCRLGMAPRRIVHCVDGRLFAVGCVESGINHYGLSDDEANMGNCLRFMDDTTFDDVERVDLEPFEMILSMQYASLKIPSPSETADSLSVDAERSASAAYKPFLLVGTAYVLPDEDEPSRGRILVYSFEGDDPTSTRSTRVVRQVTELSANGGIYSLCQFFEGRFLCSVNTKTMLCELVDDAGMRKLQYVGHGHHGHILSLSVKSRARRVVTLSGERRASGVMDENMQAGEDEKKSSPPDMLAIVGDLMRSISLIQFYPEHETLEEISRDFNSNWITAVEMLTDRVYLGAENWSNLFCLARNNSSNEEIRCRLDTIGEFHLGEMCNKFMPGSLVMPVASSSGGIDSKGRRPLSSPPRKSASNVSSPAVSGKGRAPTRTRRAVVVTGSQTLFGTVEGTLGVVLGLDGRTAAFFSTLEKAMAKVIRPVGGLSHTEYRKTRGEGQAYEAHGFVDGDLVETFLDLDRGTMEAIVEEMNRNGGWEVDDAVLRGKKDEGTPNRDPGDDAMDQDRGELSVEDVLAMVEEMTMLH